jgi:hypothetical protein
MQVIVTIAVLITCFLILTAPNRILDHSFDEATKRFAAGWIGAVIGTGFLSIRKAAGILHPSVPVLM